MTATVPSANSAEGDIEVLTEEIGQRSDEIARAMRELASLLVADESVQTTLQRVAELAKATIPGCDAAGVTLKNGKRYETVAWTDGRTLAIDEDQYSRDNGPCLEAMRIQRTVRTTVAGAQQRWPDFAAAARSKGIQSFLAAPLAVKNEGIGALNLYSCEPAGFDLLDDTLVTMFATQATVTLANARVYDQAVALSKQLEEALSTRAPIEQAKGILIARYGCSDEEAFDGLRRLSQQRNIKLREVAAELVASARRDAAGRVPAPPRRPSP